jgi:hypothetical protein
MASNYPGAIDTLATNKTDSTVAAGDHAPHHNDLADAVNKIEGALGTTPQGTSATVKARLDAVNRRYVPEGLVMPMGANSGIIPGSNVAPGTNLLWGVRCLCPVAGSLRHISWWVGASSGNLIVAVYDTGDAATTVRTKLWDSGSFAAGTAASWQTRDPGAGVIPVTKGQQVDIAIIPDNGTFTIGRGVGASAGGTWVLPTVLNTVPGATLPKMSWSLTAGSFAAPTTVAEASAGTTSTAIWIPLATII